MIELKCPHCSSPQKISPENAGTRFACLSCGKNFKVPGIATAKSVGSPNPLIPGQRIGTAPPSGGQPTGRASGNSSSPPGNGTTPAGKPTTGAAGGKPNGGTASSNNHAKNRTAGQQSSDSSVPPEKTIPAQPVRKVMNLAELDQVGGMAGSSALYSPPLDYDKLEEEMGGEAVATAELAPLTAPDLLALTPGPDPSAEIRVICRKCESMFFVPARQAGKTIQCEDCLSEIQVPASSDTARSVPLEKHRTGVQSHVDANYHNKMIEHSIEGADVPVYLREQKASWGGVRKTSEDHARAAVEKEEKQLIEEEKHYAATMYSEDEPATLDMIGWVKEMLSVWTSRSTWIYVVSLVFLQGLQQSLELFELSLGAGAGFAAMVLARFHALILVVTLFLFASFGAVVFDSIVNGYRKIGFDEDVDLILILQRIGCFLGYIVISCAPGAFFVTMLYKAAPNPLIFGLLFLALPMSFFVFYPLIQCSVAWNGVFWGIASGQVFSTINTKFGDWAKAYFLMAACLVPYVIATIASAFIPTDPESEAPYLIPWFIDTVLSIAWIFAWFMYLRVMATLCRRVCRYLYDEGNK